MRVGPDTATIRWHPSSAVSTSRILTDATALTPGEGNNRLAEHIAFEEPTMTNTSGPINQAQLIARLQRTGLSILGIQQALQGNIVTNPSDRVIIAKILAAAGRSGSDRVDVYDWVKVQEQRGQAGGADPLHNVVASKPGIQQALQANIVTSPADRANIAKILTNIATSSSGAKLEVYDWPGEYAQRFDGTKG
jgi:hypothetical protein